MTHRAAFAKVFSDKVLFGPFRLYQAGPLIAQFITLLLVIALQYAVFELNFSGSDLFKLLRIGFVHVKRSDDGAVGVENLTTGSISLNETVVSTYNIFSKEIYPKLKMIILDIHLQYLKNVKY